MWNKYQISIILFLMTSACHSPVQYSTASCGRTGFHEDNKQNETSKVFFEGRIAFDTTANEISGIVIDSNSNKPIKGAIIYLYNGSMKFADTTDASGYFSIFKNNFSGKWQMTIHDIHYQCLIIENVNIGGGISIIAKLRKTN